MCQLCLLNEPMYQIVGETTDANGSMLTDYVLSVGDTFLGEISAIGDDDWVRIDLTAGSGYEISLIGDTLEDPYLRVYDSDGALFAANDDIDYAVILDSQLAMSVNSSGTYFISARAYDDSYVGTYQLTVQEMVPPERLDAASYHEIADYLTTGFWQDVGVQPHRFDIQAGDTLSVDLSNLDADGQQLARFALDAWTYASGIEFIEVVDSDADIFMDDEDARSAYNNSVTVGGFIVQSTINVGRDWHDMNRGGYDDLGNPVFNSYTLQTWIHEIGHALGLGHAGPYNGTGGFQPDGTGDNVFLNDSWQATAMSYFSQTENTEVDASFAYLGLPMMADVLAIQDLYGVTGTLRSGDDVYGLNSTIGGIFDEVAMADGPPMAFVIVDEGGADLLDFSEDNFDRVMRLTEGSFSDGFLGQDQTIGTFGIAYGTVIENATTGQGNDEIYGNTAANILTSNAGSDTVFGGDGNDTIIGGSGHDTMYGESGNDRIIGGIGDDLLDGGLGEDRLFGRDGADTIYGADGDDYISGNGGDDQVFAGAGHDLIYASAGFDQIEGGDGNDTIYGGLDADSVSGQAGNDLIAGQDGDDVMSGDAGIDTVIGGGGNDLILGGDDNDELFGQAGDDELYGGTGEDLLLGAYGNDTIFGESGDDNVFGGFGDDSIDGGEGADVLRGDGQSDIIFGGDGHDTITGGTGRDELHGEGDDDRMFGQGGADLIYGGLGNDELFGGESNDYLSGGNGSDYLSGGIGNDTLEGGSGNDTMFGNQGEDVFRFSDATFGSDTINGWNAADDAFDFTLASLTFGDFTISEAGSDVLIALTDQPGNTITLIARDISDVSESDFLF